jgi:hypothetical protein
MEIEVDCAYLTREGYVAYVEKKIGRLGNIFKANVYFPNQTLLFYYNKAGNVNINEPRYDLVKEASSKDYPEYFI